VMRCERAGRGNGARIANADAPRPISAFAGKADMQTAPTNLPAYFLK
jgi:hypothetical protein